MKKISSKRSKKSEPKPETRPSSSRQSSSILKIPKQRKPLQCVETAPATSSESSPPTAKIKRRVSFAKNKHVREFAEVAEQGTIWDDTYEEHDLSSTKSSANETSPMMISVPTNDKENFPIQLFLPDDQTNDNLPEPDVDDSNDTIICDDDLEFASQETETDYQNETMEMTLPISKLGSGDITPITSDLLAMGLPLVDPSECPEKMKYLLNEPMEFTSILPSSTWIRIDSELTKNINVDLGEKTKRLDQSMDLTTFVPKGSIEEFTLNKKSSVELPQTVDDLSLKSSLELPQMTLPTSSTMKRSSIEFFKMENKKNVQENEDEKTKVVEKTMEFTECVPQLIKELTSKNEKTMDKSCTTEVVEKTMDFTECVLQLVRIGSKPSVSEVSTLPTSSTMKKSSIEFFKMENKKNVQDPEKTMEFSEYMPELVKNFRIMKQKSLEKSTTDFFNEKTEAIEKTMEFTECVPQLAKIASEPSSSDVIPFSMTNIGNRNNVRENEDEKTMEFTECVPEFVKNFRIMKEKSLEKSTTDFFNGKTEAIEKTMEFTECVPQLTKIASEPGSSDVTPFSMTNIGKRNNVRENEDEKTMEFTECMPEFVKNFRMIKEKSMEKGTADFFNEKTEAIEKTMEFTECVPQLVKIASKPSSRDTSTSLSSSLMTKNSAEFLNNVQENLDEETKDIEKTTEFSEYMPKLVKNVRILKEKPMKKGTTDFFNEKTETIEKTMDFTECVPQLAKIASMPSSSDVTTSLSSSSMKKNSTEFLNIENKNSVQENEDEKSMEFTECVPELVRNFRIMKEKSLEKSTTDFFNEKTEAIEKPMDFTECVPQLAKIGSKPSSSDVTTSLSSSSMTKNSTEFLNIVNKNSVQENEEEKSMEFTERVPELVKNFRIMMEKSSLDFLNEKTKAIEKTMDFTECVKTTQKSSNESNPHSFAEFSNVGNKNNVQENRNEKSMDSTECVPQLVKNVERKKKNTDFFKLRYEKCIASSNENVAESGSQKKSFSEFFIKNKDERPQTFEKTMEFYTSNSIPIPNVVDKNFLDENRTEILNRSMDFPEYIPQPIRIENGNLDIEKLPTENSEILSKSMDLTKFAPQLNLINDRDNSIGFLQKSANLTESIPQSMEISSQARKEKKRMNQSMELTSFVPQNKIIKRNFEPEVMNNRDNHMEFAEFVPQSMGILSKTRPEVKFANISKLNSDTKVLQKSMEFTSCVPQSAIIRKLNVEPKIRTPEKSMELNLDRGTEILQKSMEFTSYVPQLGIISKINPEKPEISQKSNEIEVLQKSVPGNTDVLQKIQQKPLESMNFTNPTLEDLNLSAGICKRLEEVRDDRIKFASDKSPLKIEIETNKRVKISSSALDFTLSTNQSLMCRAKADASSIMNSLTHTGTLDPMEIERLFKSNVTETPLEHNVMQENLSSFLPMRNQHLEQNDRNMSLTKTLSDTQKNDSINYELQFDKSKLDPRYMSKTTSLHSGDFNEEVPEDDKTEKIFPKDGHSQVPLPHLSMGNDTLFNTLKNRLSETTTEDSLSSFGLQRSFGRNFNDTSELIEKTEELLTGRPYLNLSNLSYTREPFRELKELSQAQNYTKVYDEPASTPVSKSLQKIEDVGAIIESENLVPPEMVSDYVDNGVDINEILGCSVNDSPFNVVKRQKLNDSCDKREQVSALDRVSSRNSSRRNLSRHSSFQEKMTLEDFAKNYQEMLALVESNEENQTNTSQIFNSQNNVSQSLVNEILNQKNQKDQSNVSKLFDKENVNIESQKNVLKSFLEDIDDENLNKESQKNISQSLGGKNLNEESQKNILHPLTVENLNTDSQENVSKSFSEDIDDKNLPRENQKNISQSLGGKNLNEESQKNVLHPLTDENLNEENQINVFEPLDNRNLNIDSQENVLKSFSEDIDGKNLNRENQKNISQSLGGKNWNEESQKNISQSLGGKNLNEESHNDTDILKSLDEPMLVDDEVAEEESGSGQGADENDSDKENYDPGNDSKLNTSVRCLFPDDENDGITHVEPPSFMDFDDDILKEQDTEESESSEEEEEEECIERYIQEEEYRKAESAVDDDKEDSFKELHQEKSVVKEEEEKVDPYDLLKEKLEATSKSDDCIWFIREMSPTLIVIEFMSKSIVVVVKLNEFEKSCNRDIEKIHIISRLRANTRLKALKIAHKELLSRLNVNNLLESHFMLEDVPKLLDHISQEVIFAVKLRDNLERIKLLNMCDLEEESMVLRAASSHANFIIKLTMNIKPLNEMSITKDLSIVQVLGEIKIHDLKKLLSNVKKDYKYFGTIVSDVKEYLDIMEKMH